jgi:hypothetical protein
VVPGGCLARGNRRGKAIIIRVADFESRQGHAVRGSLPHSMGRGSAMACGRDTGPRVAEDI